MKTLEQIEKDLSVLKDFMKRIDDDISDLKYIREKKPLPKTKDEFAEFLHQCTIRPSMTSYIEFLNDYEF